MASRRSAAVAAPAFMSTISAARAGPVTGLTFDNENAFAASHQVPDIPSPTAGSGDARRRDRHRDHRFPRDLPAGHGLPEIHHLRWDLERPRLHERGREFRVRCLRRLRQRLVSEEFFAHHGLPSERREEGERRMKDSAHPAWFACTTTLVGHRHRRHKLGRTTRSRAHGLGMRQPLCRSGRREGQSATMRVYVKRATLAGRPSA